MPSVEVAVFVAPGCKWCKRVEQALVGRGMRYKTLDVTASWRALRLLLRYAGGPVVPTVVAYGRVMVGFDLARLDQMLEGLETRAESFEISEAEQDAELLLSEAAVRQSLGDEADLPVPELEGIGPLPDDIE